MGFCLPEEIFMCNVFYECSYYLLANDLYTFHSNRYE